MRERRERHLRGRVRRELQSLGIRPPLQVDVLCERLGQRRRRPIRLMPYPIPVPGPFGLWIATTEADLILYQAETTSAHQDHIILHEVGHILADHASDETDDEVWASLMPTISPEVIRRALRRTCYSTDAECEAELVATIILDWASVTDQLDPLSSDSRLRRMEGALGENPGWP